MMSKTHLAISVAMMPVLCDVASLNLPENIGAIAFGTLLGTLVPDIDHPSAIISNKTKFTKQISEWVESRYGERRQTHTIEVAVALSLFLVFLFTLFKPLGIFFNDPAKLGWSFGIAYAVHIFSDMFTKQGCQMSLFSKVNWVVPADETKRLEVGSDGEKALFKFALVAAVFLSVYYFVGGFHMLMYHLNHSSSSAISIINNDLGEYEYLVRVKGKWTELNVHFERDTYVLGLNKEETDLILYDIQDNKVYNGYCRGEVKLTAAAVLYEVKILKKIKRKLYDIPLNDNRRVILASDIPEDSYIRGTIDMGRDKYRAEKFRVYMLDSYKTANLTIDRNGAYMIELSYMPGRIFKKHLPLLVAQKKLEIIYRK